MAGDHFYITLPSSGSIDVFPDNTLAHYRTELDRAIELEGIKYDVALVELQISAYIENVEEKKHAFDIYRSVNYIRTQTPYVDSLTVIEKDGAVYHAGVRIRDLNSLRVVSMHAVDYYEDSIYLPKGYYKDVESILKALNKELRSSPIGLDLEFRISDITPSRHFIIRFASSRKADLLDTSKFIFLPGAWFDYTMPRQRYPETSGVILFTCFFENMFSHPGMAYIYCNIVEYQFVGATRTRLLRIVNMPLNTPNITIIYDSPHYVPCASNSLTTIEIDIRTVEEKKYPFSRGTLVAKLHFRS